MHQAICQEEKNEKKVFKKGVLKNFANFTRKHPCWSLF